MNVVKGFLTLNNPICYELFRGDVINILVSNTFGEDEVANWKFEQPDWNNETRALPTTTTFRFNLRFQRNGLALSRGQKLRSLSKLNDHHHFLLNLFARSWINS